MSRHSIQFESRPLPSSNLIHPGKEEGKWHLDSAAISCQLHVHHLFGSSMVRPEFTRAWGTTPKNSAAFFKPADRGLKPAWILGFSVSFVSLSCCLLCIVLLPSVLSSIGLKKSILSSINHPAARRHALRRLSVATCRPRSQFRWNLVARMLCWPKYPSDVLTKLAR